MKQPFLNIKRPTLNINTRKLDSDENRYQLHTQVYASTHELVCIKNVRKKGGYYEGTIVYDSSK